MKDLKQDKVIKEILIFEVTQPVKKLEVVKEEVRQKFADIDVAVVSMKSSPVGSG